MSERHHGKVRLDAETFLMPGNERIDVSLYVHVKGYARARVTHLDLEKIGLGKVIHRGRGNFLEIKGIKHGLEIVLRERGVVEIEGKKATVTSIRIVNPLLNEIVEENESTRAWVGRKYDGIYIGFRKREVKRLEKIALKKFGIKPLEKLEKPPLV